MVALTLGSLLSPRRILRAYSQGRKSRNLFTRKVDDTLLDRTVESVRAELAITP